MSYQANAEQGQRLISAASGDTVAPAGDVTKNRIPFTAEQAEVLIDLLRNGGEGGTTDHRQLSNRDATEQHPMSAITGLSDALAGKGTYSKPSGGIPKTDLASAVQASLGLADAAVQPTKYATDVVGGAIKTGLGTGIGNQQNEGRLIATLQNKSAYEGASNYAFVSKGILNVLIDDKVDKSQGAAHAGEFLVVGSDGNITTRTLASSADDVSYDNTESGLTATDVQGAIDELAKTPKNYLYNGADLSTVFASAAAFHAAIAAGDFSKIRIGDYYPITLNGSYKDYARFTVPSGTTYYSDADLTTEVGTTEADAEGEYQSATAIKFEVSGANVYADITDCTAGFVKTMNATMKMEIAAINPYLRHGDTELTAQHILLCSRDCMPNTMQVRCNNSVWHDTSKVNPWLGSALYETLNNAENGIIKLLEATELGAYVFGGPNGKGMRAWLETMAAGAGSPTTAAWSDRGRLFLPTEREVYGAPVWQANGYAANVLYNQWPIFAGSGRHIIKGAGDGGGRSSWWLEAAYSATSFTRVNSNGIANYDVAANTNIRVPLCFLVT